MRKILGKMARSRLVSLTVALTYLVAGVDMEVTGNIVSHVVGALFLAMSVVRGLDARHA